jgi:molecular chaperone GrpE
MKNKNEEKENKNLKNESEEKTEKNTPGEIEISGEEISMSEETVNKTEEDIVKENIKLSKDYNLALDKIEKLDQDNKDLKDQLLRKVAEFENAKRRNENDQMNLLKYAAESFIINILPIYDDFERSISHIDNENNIAAVKNGLKIILEKFTKTLNDQGIKRIEAKGKPFDVEYHEALMQQINNDVPPHTVLEEIDPGYIYKDKVIKHTKVIVSQETAEDKPNESNKDENHSSNNQDEKE